MSTSDSKFNESSLAQSIIDQPATAATTTVMTAAAAPKEVYFVGFNQDCGCFSVGVDSGFRIYNCDPYKPLFVREFAAESGGGAAGVSTVALLFRFSMMVIVGGGPQPLRPSNKMMIWDDVASRFTGELSFRAEIRSVKLRKDRIFVVLTQSVYAYNFEDLRLVQQLDTVANPKGLLEVSQSSGPNIVMVCPGLHKGQVRIELYGLKKTLFVTAHDSKVAALALALDGKLMATASSKGTLVRIFNTSDGSRLQEVRRGADRAEIYSIAFSGNTKWSDQWLAVASDKGTVHVFNLKADSDNFQTKARSSKNAESKLARLQSLSVIKGVLPRYFSSEWSVAQFRLPEGLHYTVGFGTQKNSVLVIGMDGSFYRCQFDPVNGGEMTQLEYYNFLKPPE